MEKGGILHIVFLVREQEETAFVRIRKAQYIIKIVEHQKIVIIMKKNKHEDMKDTERIRKVLSDNIHQNLNRGKQNGNIQM